MNLSCPDKTRNERTSDGALLWRAPAKINLTLRVLGRRDDGYHELDSIVAKVTLYDELIFRRREDGRVNLTCTGPDCGPVEENLVLRAAELLPENAIGADIELTKRIPSGAGLGGGSSDAAAALTALNRLWELNLSNEQLSNLGASIGSDVPLFLNDAPAVRIRGRGDIIEPVQVHTFAALLYLPDLHCPTVDVYAVYKSTNYTNYTNCLKKNGNRKSAIENPQSAIRNPQLDSYPSRWRGELFNDLQAAAMQVCPSLSDIISLLAEATGLPVHITGSGSAMFIICDNADEAKSTAERLPDEMKKLCRVVSLNPW